MFEADPICNQRFLIACLILYKDDIDLAYFSAEAPLPRKNKDCSDITWLNGPDIYVQEFEEIVKNRAKYPGPILM